MTPIDLTLPAQDDEQLSVKITSKRLPLDLTGCTVTAYFKTAAGVADDDDTTIVLTSPDDITIDNPVGGRCTVNLPVGTLDDTIKFWRLTVTDAEDKQNTAIYGQVSLTSL